MNVHESEIPLGIDLRQSRERIISGRHVDSQHCQHGVPNHAPSNPSHEDISKSNVVSAKAVSIAYMTGSIVFFAFLFVFSPSHVIVQSPEGNSVSPDRLKLTVGADLVFAHLIFAASYYVNNSSLSEQLWVLIPLFNVLHWYSLNLAIFSLRKLFVVCFTCGWALLRLRRTGFWLGPFWNGLPLESRVYFFSSQLRLWKGFFWGFLR